MTDIRRFLMLSAATLSMGALISAGCSDDETTASTNTTQSTASSMGGNNTGGMGAGASGGGAQCTPTDECETCAATECQDLALACCMADGCQELVRCVGEKCNDAPADQQQACAIAECPDEVGAAAAAGSTTAAQDLGACITPALECPEAGSACETCANMFGGGGSGGGAGGACP